MPNDDVFAELDLTLQDAEKQPELYRATSFWRAASLRIADELKASGIENFRRIKSALGYFVPNFGPPTNSFSVEHVESLMQHARHELKVSDKTLRTLDQYLSGYFHARSDYRVLKASDTQDKKPFLHDFSESEFGRPVEQFEFDGKRFSRSSLNYLLGLSMLKQQVDTGSIRTVLEIGGGFGTLGEILAQSGLPQVRYIDVDIPPTQFVAAQYLSHVLGRDRVAGYSDTRDRTIDIAGLPTATVLCNWQIEQLKGHVDLFVNFISFQEMEPHVVRNYLHHVDRLQARWILLRNMREGKQKRTATSHGVETPILSDDYIRMLGHYKLIARNVHPFGFETADGFNSELLLLERGG